MPILFKTLRNEICRTHSLWCWKICLEFPYYHTDSLAALWLQFKQGLKKKEPHRGNTMSKLFLVICLQCPVLRRQCMQIKSHKAFDLPSAWLEPKSALNCTTWQQKLNVYSYVMHDLKRIQFKCKSGKINWRGIYIVGLSYGISPIIYSGILPGKLFI